MDKRFLVVAKRGEKETQYWRSWAKGRKEVVVRKKTSEPAMFAYQEKEDKQGSWDLTSCNEK